MSAQDNKAPSTSIAELETETQSEIDRIMAEIEELQKEMASVDGGGGQPSAAAATMVVPPAPETAKPKPAPAPVPVAAAPAPTPAPAPKPVAEPITDAPVAEAVESDALMAALDEAITAEMAAAVDVSVPEAAAPAPVAPVATETVTATATASATASDTDTGTDTDTDSENEASILKEFSGAGEEPWFEETMAHLNSAENEVSLLDQHTSQQSVAAKPTKKEAKEKAVPSKPVTSRPMLESVSHEDSHEDSDLSHLAAEETTRRLSAFAAGSPSLSMAIEGNMSVQFMHKMTGQEVSIAFSEESIRVQFADGTEFKIPIRRAALKRVV